MTVDIVALSRAQFTIESGNWMSMRRLCPELNGVTAEELLRRTQQDLLVPLRYGKSAKGVVLIGECPVHSCDEICGEEGASSPEELHDEAKNTLQDWLQRVLTPAATVDRETVETALGEAVHGWTQREDCWIVPTGTQSPVELRVTLVARGLRIEGLLVSDDANDAIARRALAEFLCRVQLELRFSRVEMDEQVRVVSEVDAIAMQRNFGHSLGSVAETCRMLLAEVRALSTPELAEAYLSHRLSL